MVRILLNQHLDYQQNGLRSPRINAVFVKAGMDVADIGVFITLMELMKVIAKILTDGDIDVVMVRKNMG